MNDQTLVLLSDTSIEVRVCEVEVELNADCRADRIHSGGGFSGLLRRSLNGLTSCRLGRIAR